MPMHLSSRKLVLKWRVGSFGRATVRLRKAGPATDGWLDRFLLYSGRYGNRELF